MSAEQQQQQKLTMTRRAKRKAEEFDKTPLEQLKETSIFEARKKASPTPVLSSAKNKVRSTPPVKSKSPRKSSQVDKRKSRIRSLLKNANVDSTLLSQLESELANGDGDSSPCNDQSDPEDKTPPRPPSRRSNHMRRNTGTARSDTATPSDDNEDLGDDEQIGEYQAEVLKEQDKDDIEEEEEGQNSDDYDEQCARAKETDGGHYDPNFGNSDEEQEVSFNVECDNVEDEPRDNPPNRIVDSTALVPITPSQLERVGGQDTTTLLGRDDSVRASGNVDESVILNVIESLKSAVSVTMKEVVSQALSEIKRDRDEIKKLREHISEVTSIMTTTICAMFMKQVATTPRMKEIQNKLCLLPVLFTDSYIVKVLPRVLIGFLVTIVKDGAAFTDLEMQGIEFLIFLYFSIQPNERKKEKYASNVGHIYSKFRYGLLTSSFLAMQTNAFQTFRSEPIHDEVFDPNNNNQEQCSSISPSVSAMLQPFWLKPGYVLSQHCSRAAKKLERREGIEVSSEVQSIADSPSANVDSETT